jgi:hypothetical protein
MATFPDASAPVVRPDPPAAGGETGRTIKRWWGTPAATLAIFFVGLVVSRWHILDSPPYVEQMVSQWTEGCWLDEYDFAYRRLHDEELHSEDGGPRNVMTSVVPTIIALLARLTGSTEGAIVGYRLFNLLCAAIGATIFLRLVAVATNSLLAWGATLGMLTLPLYSVQLDMLGMDIPLAMAALVCARLVGQRKFVVAAGTSWLAYLFKPSGFLIPAALIAWLAVALLLRVAARRFAGAKGEVAGLIAAIVTLALQIAVFLWAGNAHGRVQPFSDLNLWIMSCPDLLALSAACLLGGALLLWRRRREKHAATSVFSRACDLAVAEPLVGFAACLVLGTYAAGSLTWYESRHLTIAVPFVWLLLARVIAALIQPRGWQFAICAALVAINLVNRNGDLYPELPTELARGWGIPERSHEYQRDHHSNLFITAMVEKKFQGRAIICTEHFLYLLTLPALGYVNQSLTGGPCDYRFAAYDDNLLQIVEDLPRDVVVVLSKGLFTEFPFPAYSIAEPGAADTVEFDDGLRPPHRVYVHRFSDRADLAGKMRERLDLLFSNATELDPAVRLAVLGRRDLANRYLDAEAKTPLDEAASETELKRRLQAEITARAERPEAHDAAFDLPDRLDEFLARRLDELQRGVAWQPLRWSERSWSDTLPQRIRYIPAQSASKLTREPKQNAARESPLADQSRPRQ